MGLEGSDVNVWRVEHVAFLILRKQRDEAGHFFLLLSVVKGKGGVFAA